MSLSSWFKKDRQVSTPVAVIIILVMVVIIAFYGWRTIGPSGPVKIKVVTQKPGQPFAGAKKVYGIP